MYQLILIPIISAFIGYFTNVLAIRLLFWPREPVNLGFYKMQGLLPKRQSQIATSLGELVEEQLLSVEDLFDQFEGPEIQDKLINQISQLMRARIADVLPRIIPGRFTQMIADAMDRLLRQEAPGLMTKLMQSGKDYLTNEIKVSQMVEEKVNDYDLKELEDMIKGVSIEELTFIEILGGVVGFIIGIVQVIILCIFPIV